MSTKCQPPWQIVLKPSQIHRGLICLLAGVSLLALFSTAANIGLLLGCAVAVVLVAIYQYRATAGLTTLIHDSSEGIWRLNCSGKQEAKGKLICAGYQSACLVILVIQQENTRYQYCSVWQDQISGSDFSYLHHQMLFNTSAPLRQPLKILLSAEKIL